MNVEDRIAALERKVQYLADRQQILDCVTRTARGNDRFDVELICSGYHSDGLHEIGNSAIPGVQYGDHANRAHRDLCERNLHNVTMQICEIDGDTAHAESYVIGLFLDKDCRNSRILAGRYIDRLERRDGEWRIVVRRATVEVNLEGPATMFNTEAFRNRGYLKGTRDKDDLSYHRPLGMEDSERWTP